MPLPSHDSPDSPGSPDPAGPAAIVDIATGYMAAKQLFAASEAGIFAALSRGPATAAELAGRAGLPERTARILADTLSGLGLLTRADGAYANAPAAARYLAGDGDLDLRPFLTFLDRISYGHWLGFAETTRTAGPAPLDLADGRMDTFLTGVMTYNALHARMLATHFDFSPYARILDFGGLSGAFLSEALRAAPSARGTFLSGGDLAGHARKTLSDAGVGDRADVVEADPLTGDVPEPHDLVLLEHVVHRFGVDVNREIIRRARRAAEPGATLLLLDFFLDDAPEQRVIDALHAGEYLVIDGTVVYPEADVRAWLREAGWEPVETRALPGSPRVIVAEAR